ncbi:hypothetical protein ABBQ32_005623 [Trebouxia sp. C0010 RCD-2024]
MVQASYAAAQTPVEGLPTEQASTADSATKAITEVLRLRLAPRRKAKAVRWSEDVVDNEFMNKKKSKKCCIFHKQKSFGDWSDDDSDGECTDCHKVSDSNKPEVQSDLSSS